MADTPSVNGNIPSWADIIIKIDDDRYYGITEISYEDARERALVYGMNKSGGPRGMTSGKYTPSASSMTMDKVAARELKAALAARSSDGKSFGNTEFQVVVQYAAEGQPVQTDTLSRCRITGNGNSHSEGSDALTESIPFQPLAIDYDGLTLYDSSEGEI